MAVVVSIVVGIGLIVILISGGVLLKRMFSSGTTSGSIGPQQTPRPYGGLPELGPVGSLGELSPNADLGDPCASPDDLLGG
jgi:hypothetical protein